ncbi:MAG: DUF1549 domain-containing protein [Planctomycetes bacterium]|nr:DUF1549 domain-containing protein [Planctomycetota bacterium]
MRIVQRLTRHLVLSLGALAMLSSAEAGKAAIERTEQPKAPKGASEQPAVAGDFDEAAIKKAAGDIDAIIDAGLTKDKIKPTAKTRDDQFLRRIYLDLAGRIPTIGEAGPFLASSKKDKREALVKQLLASEGYVSNTFTWWADMLRARSRLQDRYDGQPYIDWIKQSVRENKPYDKMVYELICAQGPGTKRGNGATGYYAADAGMPQDNMANTVRLFLGTRLSCAQCHNHPFDKWTRKDFFQMTAFTEGTDVKTNEGEVERAVKGLKGDAPYSTGNIARRMGETLGMNVTNGDKGEIGLPDNYQYDDAHPRDRIRARTMFNEDILSAGAVGVRDAYGKWMTSPNNARFTLVAANRLWKRLMRIGFIEPLDNLEDDTKPFNQELADYLVQMLKDVHYDTRKFQEVVCRTSAYQRQSIAGDADRFKFHHEGQPLRRLTAEQMWDSLVTLTVPDVDGIKDDSAETLYRFYDANHDKSTQELAQIVLKAGEAQDQIDDYEKQMREIRLGLEKGGDKGQAEAKIKDLQGKQNALRPAADMFSPYYAKGGNNLGPMRRASELPSPMPPGHFLRVFGQSNRQLIDNSTDSLNLTQALELMNGMVETTIFGDDKSALSLELAKGRNLDDKVLILYASILSRRPAGFEIEYGHKVMALAPNHRGVQYLGWALVNSAEFAFNE